ncbi:MAG: hypothetical protein KDD38_11535, partial [Bdellovibrionales bacterium]|nr:hypothetical protein [Bdellovibrionales bacterium]
IYYWRVAAGSNSGRMGLFSEMATLDLTNVDSRESGEIAPGVKLVTPKEVQIKPLTKIPEEAIAAAKLAESELTESKQKSQDDKAARAEQPSTWAFSTDLNLHYLNYSLDKNFSATLSGFANFSFGADATLTKGNKDKYIFTAGLTQAEWKPEEPSTLPYQEELSTTAYALRALYEQADSEISYGLHVESQPLLHRVGLEQLQKTDILMYGGALGYNTAVADDITFRSVGSLLTGSSVSAVMGHNSIHYHFGSKGWSPYLGGDFNFKLFFGSDSLSGFYLTTGLHLGLNW